MKENKKYKWTMFAIKCYRMIMIPLVFATALFIISIFFLILSKFNSELNSDIELYKKMAIVNGILTGIFIILINIFNQSKRFMNKHYEFDLVNTLNPNKLISAISHYSKNYQKVEHNNMIGHVLKKSFPIVNYTEYHCYFLLEYKCFENIKFQEDLTNIKSLMKKFTNSIPNKGYKSFNVVMYIIVFVSKWNNEIEQKLDMYALGDVMKSINIVAIHDNKLYVRPMYFEIDNSGGYTYDNKNLFKIINSIK